MQRFEKQKRAPSISAYLQKVANSGRWWGTGPWQAPVHGAREVSDTPWWREQRWAHTLMWSTVFKQVRVTVPEASLTSCFITQMEALSLLFAVSLMQLPAFGTEQCGQQCLSRQTENETDQPDLPAPPKRISLLISSTIFWNNLYIPWHLSGNMIFY